MKKLRMSNGDVVDADVTTVGYTDDCPECPGRIVHVEGVTWACLKCEFSTRITREDADA